MYSSARLIAFSFVSKISSCDSVLDEEWGRFRVGGMRFFLARRDSIEKLRSEFVAQGGYSITFNTGGSMPIFGV